MEYAEQIWTEFSSQFAPAVKEVVEFAKQIPQFMELEEDDQVQLMKSGAFEVSIGVGGQNGLYGFQKYNTILGNNNSIRITV